MTIRFTQLLKCGCLLAALAPISAPAAPAPPVGVSCSPLKGRYIASSLDGVSVNSGPFVNIPETRVAFTLGGTSPSCVIVRFSAVTHVANNILVIRPVLDTSTFGLPAQVIFLNSDATVESGHTFEFIFPGVAPGNHTVRMQAQGVGTISRRNTGVLFAQ